MKRIAQEDPVSHIDDAAERGKRQIGRPSAVANFRKQVIEIVQQTPDLASLEILRRVREAGYQGGKKVECTPKVRHEIKGPITLNGGEQCLCPDRSIPAN